MVTALASGTAAGVAVLMEQQVGGGARRASHKARGVERVAMPVDGDEVLTSEDGRGAQIVHALLVNNAPPAVALALQLIALRPELLVAAHGEGPFEGESCVHVLAVNSREDELLRLLRLAAQRLDVSERRLVLAQQACNHAC